MILALSFLLTVALEWAVLAWFRSWLCADGMVLPGDEWRDMGGGQWHPGGGECACPSARNSHHPREAVVLAWFWQWRPRRAMLARS